jgi:hypothetical protein
MASVDRASQKFGRMKVIFKACAGYVVTTATASQFQILDGEIRQPKAGWMRHFAALCQQFSFCRVWSFAFRRPPAKYRVNAELRTANRDVSIQK